MKILVISNVSEHSGYSYAAESTIKSLFYNKVDVVARNVSLTGNKRNVDNVIQKCLDKSATDCDYLIIHSLPSFFEYNGIFKKCIGKFDYETSFGPSNWKKKCQLMDQIWVSTEDAREKLMRFEQITKPVFSIKHAVDINRFEQDTSKLKGIIHRHKKKTDSYCFYTIGEFVARKNYEGLLTAWYSAFSQKDNVDLFIKTSMPNNDPEQAKIKIMRSCEQIKNGLKLNKRYLKDPIIIPEPFNELAIDTLHANGDCFISASHAEGCCLPARDALLFGNPAILPEHTGFAELIGPSVTSIDSEMVPCYGAVGDPKEIYNGSSQWFNPSIKELIHSMKFHYKNQESMKNLGLLGKKLINEYSYQSIGKQMIKVLSV